jgi:single-strand DNA-binding protein
MPYLNNCNFVGHAGNDAKNEISKNGISYTKFTLAYSSKRKGVEKTIWINCTAFGKTAEYCLSKVRKGDLIQVIGEIDVDAYERKQDGKPAASVSLVVEKFLWLRSAVKNDVPTSPEAIPTFDNTFNSTIPLGANDESDIPF